MKIDMVVTPYINLYMVCMTHQSRWHASCIYTFELSLYHNGRGELF
jgi:hypothetical protein